MNREVFLSILAMDAYQRGYATGINGVTGAKIGHATIRRQSDVRPGSDAVAAGFYALSYTLDTTWAGLASGTTVISYRGTDFDPGGDDKTVLSGAEELYRDFFQGWSTFLFPGLGLTTQFDLPASDNNSYVRGASA